MVLTPSRYLNWFQSYSFFNIDMSKSLQTLNHDDVRRHDSTVHYIFYDDVRRHDSSKLVNVSSNIYFVLYCIIAYFMQK